MQRNQKLTFNRSIIVTDGDVVKAALCWHILDCYGPVLVRLDGRLWASCGRHRHRLNGRKSRSTGAYHTHTQQWNGDRYSAVRASGEQRVFALPSSRWVGCAHSKTAGGTVCMAKLPVTWHSHHGCDFSYSLSWALFLSSLTVKFQPWKSQSVWHWSKCCKLFY